VSKPHQAIALGHRERGKPARPHQADRVDERSAPSDRGHGRLDDAIDPDAVETGGDLADRERAGHGRMRAIDVHRGEQADERASRAAPGARRSGCPGQEAGPRGRGSRPGPTATGFPPHPLSGRASRASDAGNGQHRARSQPREADRPASRQAPPRTPRRAAVPITMRSAASSSARCAIFARDRTLRHLALHVPGRGPPRAEWPSPRRRRDAAPARWPPSPRPRGQGSGGRAGSTCSAGHGGAGGGRYAQRLAQRAAAAGAQARSGEQRGRARSGGDAPAGRSAPRAGRSG